jgi:hypothetical protein
LQSVVESILFFHALLAALPISFQYSDNYYSWCQNMELTQFTSSARRRKVCLLMVVISLSVEVTGQAPEEFATRIYPSLLQRINCVEHNLQKHEHFS